MASSRIPLVLLPGLLCDRALWQHQIKSLETIADCSVADTTGFPRMDAVARHVLSLAPREFALAGLSMGGYVALEIMRQAPERVLKVCLLDTSARADTSEQRERRRALIAMAQSGKFKGVTPRLLPLLIHPKRLQDQELTGLVTAMAERVGKAAFENQQTAILNRIDSYPTLKTIRCPVQIIGGKQDLVSPPELMREMSEALVHSRYDILDECGHLSTLEQPEAVTRLMKRWVQS